LNVDAPRFGNYFGVTSQGIVKYHAKPTNQVILENGNWSPEGRQEIKIGKLISYLFEQNPPVIESSSAVNPQNAITRYIESVTHSIKATPSIEIKITNDINKIYKMPVSAFLRSQSCMVGRSFDFNVIYDQLRKRGVKVSILYTTEVIKKVETLTSRAIIWHNVKAKSNIMKRLKLTNTFTLIDRIYGGDKYEQLYKEYAIANGYFHKVQQSCHHHSIINPVSNISLISKDYYIFLRNNKKMEFGITVAPYMDTFFGMYGTVLNGTGTLEHLVAQFRNTNGHPRMYDFRRYA
ncbi:MAG: hypothetical protein FWG20_05740, partial [Candidatus Cloacimonetes bacterium]|nr:hypothetical protein [Candidatus Cloacimonadota bacterium]